MKRILVVGCCGAGKSVLSRALAEATGLPLIHLDREHWLPGWREPEPEVWRARVDELVAGERWIIDGNYQGSLERRLARADAVVFLDLPRWRCVVGVLGRVLRGHGRSRADMAPGCPERFDLEFLRYVWRFRRDKRPKLIAALERYERARVFVLTSRRQVRRFPERLSGR